MSHSKPGQSKSLDINAIRLTNGIEIQTSEMIRESWRVGGDDCPAIPIRGKNSGPADHYDDNISDLSREDQIIRHKAGRNKTLIRIAITSGGPGGQKVVYPGEGEGLDVDWVVRVGLSPPEVTVSGVLGRKVVVLCLTVYTVSSQGLQLLLAGGDVEDSDGPVSLSVDYFVSEGSVLVMTDTTEERSLQSVCVLHDRSWQQGPHHVQTSPAPSHVTLRLSSARCTDRRPASTLPNTHHSTVAQYGGSVRTLHSGTVRGQHRQIFISCEFKDLHL